MAFQQDIMSYAQQIQAAAIRRAYQNHEAYPATPPKGGAVGNGRPMHPYENGVEQYYANIPSLFQPFSLLPDPVAYNPMVDGLRQAMGILRVNADTKNPVDPNDQLGLAGPEFGRLASGSSILSSWNGSAAVAFKGNFLGPFNSYTQNQFVLLAVLKSAVEAHQAMWKGARDDITKIAQGTLDALENYGGCNQNTLVMTFTVLSLIASIVGAPLGELPAVGVAAIGAAFSMAATATPLVVPGSDQQSVSGDTAAQITDNMHTLMNGLTRRISQAQDAISQNIDSTISAVVDNRSTYFEAPRPALADMSTTQAETDQGLGVPG